MGIVIGNGINQILYIDNIPTDRKERVNNCQCIIGRALEKQRVFSVSSAFRRTLGYTVSNM